MAGDNEAGLRLVVENGQGFVGALNDAHAAQTRFVDGLGQTAAKSGGFGQINRPSYSPHATWWACPRRPRPHR